MLGTEGLQERLAEAAARCRVPGAVLGVLRGTETRTAAYGVLDVETGYPVTTDALFQTGSVAKAWTATLILQLVDEGLAELDAPVARYLPGFQVVDPEVSATVTLRQLLCHTGGFEGDIHDDHGPGDDAVSRLVAGLATTAPQLFPAGTMFSYCNSGYVVLGRIVSELTGLTWEDALRERIAVPLGMARVATSPAEAIRYRVAMGHLSGPAGTPVKAPVWAMPRSNAPAGSTLALSMDDQLRFARLHLAEGLAPDSTRVLSKDAVRQMRTAHTPVPLPAPAADHWGLGWALHDWNGAAVVGHAGATFGQAARLLLVPERDVAVALFTNGGAHHGLHRLLSELLDELAGVTAPPLPAPPAAPPTVDLRYFTGRYLSGTLSAEVGRVGDALSVALSDHGAAALTGRAATPEPNMMVPLDDRSLVSVEARAGRHDTYTFVGGGDRARHLHTGRAIPRV